jgi:hypothetical protein
VFASGKPFQTSLFFVGKAGAYSIEEPFRCSTLMCSPGLAQKLAQLITLNDRHDKHIFMQLGFSSNTTSDMVALTNIVKNFKFCGRLFS